MIWPTVDPEPQPQKKAGKKRKRRAPRRSQPGPVRNGLRRFLRRVVFVFVLLAALPFVLTLLYRLPAIHPISTLMLKDLVLLESYERDWVSLEEMGPTIQHSVMMSEDGQFCVHGGIDWSAINLVIGDALSGERPRGASTIPMQTVKNLFLWQGRSFIRKAAEVPLALYLDTVMPKRRILEIYLNIAEWGPNIYGVEAAAQYYFGRPAQNLTRRQAALLAVALPNPIGRNPAKPSAGLSRLARVIERRARQAGGYVGCLQ